MTRSASPRSEKSVSQTGAGDAGLLFGCQLDGRGGGRAFGWKQIEGASFKRQGAWIHLDRSQDRAASWLRDESGLTQITADALLMSETRPRVFRGKKGYVAILRGVNTNKGADPEDMVAIRLWCDGKLLISVREHKLLTPRDILEELGQGQGPSSTPELFVRLISRLIERLGPVIGECDEALDQIEEDVESESLPDLRRRLNDLRRETITLRRYMSPQRQALTQLLSQPPDWLDERQRLWLRETSDQLQRYIEDLDAARERAVVLIDEIATRLAESMNRNIYIFSLVALVFLPLGFLTGLLGINVGGMPGIDNPDAFWITIGLIVIVLAFELALLRKLKLL